MRYLSIAVIELDLIHSFTRRASLTIEQRRYERVDCESTTIGNTNEHTDQLAQDCHP